jgi:hypothetical protein
MNVNRLLIASTCAALLSPTSTAQGGGSDIFDDPTLFGFANNLAVAGGDIDADGDIDLLTTDPPRRDSFGTLVSPGEYYRYVNGSAPASFAGSLIDGNHGGHVIKLGDLNGDGVLDAVSSNTIANVGNLTNVLIGLGAGQFAPVVSYGSHSSEGSRALALADMDNDGDLDLVLPNGGRVMRNAGDGTFFTDFVGSDVAVGASIAIGDLDEDGHLDIVTSVDSYSPARTYIKMQLGVGGGAGNPGPEQQVQVGGDSPSAVALGDLNNDGHLDLLTINAASADLSVLLGLGDGTFMAPVIMTLHTASYFVPRTMVLGDFDSDGQLDVAVSSTVYGSATSQQETSILLGNGAGNLQLVQIIERFGRLGQNMVAVDVDGDGDMDLTTASHFMINSAEDGIENFCVATPNSTGSAALMGFAGSTSVAMNNFVLRAQPGPIGQPGIFFFGPSENQVALGNGFLCVGAPLVRLSPTVVFDSTGRMSHALDLTAHTAIVSGSTWNFQAWFRDPAAGGAFFDLSDGLSVMFQP